MKKYFLVILTITTLSVAGQNHLLELKVELTLQMTNLMTLFTLRL